MNPTRTPHREALACLVSAFVLGLASSANAQVVDIFHIGIDNGNQSEFAVESVALIDYYWENGDYFDLGGEDWTAGQEPFDQFPRALTTGFSEIFIYFQLDAIESHPDTNFTFFTEAVQTRTVDGNSSTHDIEFEMNGELFGEIFEQADGEISITFNSGDVAAVNGSNLLVMRRFGGELPWPAEGEEGAPDFANSAWIQFDELILTADLDGVPCTEPICTFGATGLVINPGQSTSLNWLASPNSSLSIAPDIGNVDAQTTAGAGSFAVSPTQNTIYTLIANGGTASREVEVTVRNIFSFTSEFDEIDSGDPVLLEWETDPSASLSIDQGIGPVSSGTSDIEINPTETTTYTLTSIRGADVETREVTVNVPLIRSFTASDFRLVQGDGETEVTLDWDTDPSATVTLEPGIGVTTDFSASLSPSQTTTYTLTSTIGDRSEVSTLTIFVTDFIPLLSLGENNDSTVDFEQESSGMEEFYVENGDYGDLGGLDWTLGPEPLNDDSFGDPGFPRSVTVGFTEFTIFFQIPDGLVDAPSELEFYIELILPRTVDDLVSEHDLEFYMNDTIFGEAQGVSSGALNLRFDASLVSAAPGPNALTIVRTGGTIPWPVDGSPGTPEFPEAAWIQFDEVSLGVSAAPALPSFMITSITPGSLAGTFDIVFQSDVGALYTIERSTDLATWTPVETDLPASGEGTTSFTLSPGGDLDGRVYYRVLKQ